MNEVLFITGLPRSGTKLLRDLLNNHPRISVPTIETVLIPYLTNKFGVDFDLNKKDNFLEVCQSFEASTFYNSYKRKNRDIKLRTLFDSTEPISWTFIFEEILKFYGPKEYNKSVVIGDKTPGYIDHTDLLLTLWPNGKIIHIVRDPRDYVCSVNKVWNKNIYRAANRWQNTMNRLQMSGNLSTNNIVTIKYEDLLERPEAILREISNFLNLEFVPEMLTLNRSSERFGDAKGHTSILRTNKNKYKTILSKKQLYRVERIVRDGALLLGYELVNTGISSKKLSWLELLGFKLMDGLNSLMFHVREKGILRGSRYFFQFHKENI